MVVSQLEYAWLCEHPLGALHRVVGNLVHIVHYAQEEKAAVMVRRDENLA